METICILSGIYEEQVIIYRPNLNMIGIGAIEMTMNRYATEMDEAGQEIGTFATPTLFLGGLGGRSAWGLKERLTAWKMISLAIQ